MDERTDQEGNEPTVLSAEQVAVVYDEENGYQILLPQYDDEDELPAPAAALVAAGLRLSNDEEFGRDLLRWLENHSSAQAE